MIFRTHILFSFFIALFLVKILELKNPVLFIAILCLFGILPDIDYHKSKVGRKAKILSHVINFIFGHRGIFHSVFVPLLFYLFFLLINQKILGLAALLGYISHLFLDSFTIAGIKPLYPVYNKKIKGFIKTGSFIETILFFVVLILCVFLLFSF